MNRYIKKDDRNIVDNESCFKCSWCGVQLFERHHIQEYALGGLNSADNLILLCPNCHTEAHNDNISKAELETRKKELNGSIDKASGCLSINGTPAFIAGGTKYEGGIERILVHNNEDYLRIEKSNKNLLISLKLFDKDGKLICWMNKNRWWVENRKIFDFEFKKQTLKIQSDAIDSILYVEINENIVKLKCKMYIEGRLIEFDEKTINIGNSIFKVGTISGNKNCVAISV